LHNRKRLILNILDRLSNEELNQLLKGFRGLEVILEKTIEIEN
jgi:hypothetical protein